MASEGTPIIIKKKKAHGHAHHGGSWKVAYADFVTAMMAFFMVMWILGLSDEAKTTISGYFNDPFGYSKTQPFSRNIVKGSGMPVTSAGTVKEQKANITKKDKVTMTKVQSAIEKAIEEAIRKGEAAGGAAAGAAPGSLKELLKHVNVTMDPDEGLRIEFMEDKSGLFFATGSYRLRENSLAIAKMLAPILKASGRPLRIEGHTDARPYGSGATYDNYDLSQDRANEMRRALRAFGLPQKQVEGVFGFADQRLKFQKDPFSPKNRRVSILLPFQEEPKTKEVDLLGDFKEDFNKKVDLVPTINVTTNKVVDDGKPVKKNFWGGQPGSPAQYRH